MTYDDIFKTCPNISGDVGDSQTDPRLDSASGAVHGRYASPGIDIDFSQYFADDAANDFDSIESIPTLSAPGEDTSMIPIEYVLNTSSPIS